MDLQLAYTAIPRRTAGFRLVSEPRPDLLKGKETGGAAGKAVVVGPEPKPGPGKGVGRNAAPAPVVRVRPEGRKRLRAAIMDRLGRDMADVLPRLAGLLANADPRRSGA